MTISSEISRLEYAGDGVTAAFATNPGGNGFYFNANADVLIYIRDASGNATLQTITTHYTLTGAGDQNGGTVTMVTAPASGETLVVIHAPEFKQTLDLITAGKFPAESIESALDRIVHQVQRNQDLINRAITLNDGDPATGGAYDVNSNRMENVSDPVNNQDAATKLWALSQNASLFTETGIVSIASARSLAATDKGKVLYLTGTTYALTIEPDATLEFAIGTMILLNCNTSGNVTITRGSGVALNWFDGISASDANRTITVGGVACLVKRAADTWHIWGNGGLT